MRSRRVIGIVVALALAGLLAAVAVAQGVLSITPVASVVAYPRPARVVVVAPEAVAMTITVEARAAGGDWSTVKSIPASAAALGTTFTVNPKLRLTSGVRAVQGAYVSEVVTISVKAKLVPVRVIRHRGVFTVMGAIAPAHANGTSIGLHVWKRTGKGRHASLTPLPDIHGTVYKHNSQIAWWKASFDPESKGVYVIRAFHEDDGHVLSVSRARTFKVRRP